ncbi:MAG TPA: peptide ABC transporter permease [Rhizobiaceae bacterium]|nr:peptide ABC transporter permease [Rhizobiaceae bacterium]
MAKDGSKQPTYDAEKVRQGEIILRTRTRRVIFISGLVGIVVLALLIALLG